RHTRFSRDWSSDVCSSDLLTQKRISAFDYEHRNRGDDFELLMEHLLRFDQIVFASPIYWYAVAPPMKVFLDRISDYLDLPDLLEIGSASCRERVDIAHVD